VPFNTSEVHQQIAHVPVMYWFATLQKSCISCNVGISAVRNHRRRRYRAVVSLLLLNVNHQ
jgi:hypothetical protein